MLIRIAHKVREKRKPLSSELASGFNGLLSALIRHWPLVQ
jgi:hypothetical protein